VGTEKTGAMEYERKTQRKKERGEEKKEEEGGGDPC